LLAVTERGICGLNFINGETWKEAVASLQSQWEGAILKEDIKETKPLAGKIFATNPPDDQFSARLFLKGSNFQIKVWAALLRIPFGSVCSYGDIAAYLGQPTAARAVGNAVAANPVAYMIPCHRVIRKIGVFGDYSHGSGRKKAMIGWEAAQRYKR